MLTTQWFVGIDWASEAHEVCVLDREGHVGERRQVRHTAPDLQAFVDALLARAGGEATTVAVGIEVPRGALVELLVERGFGPGIVRVITLPGDYEAFALRTGFFDAVGAGAVASAAFDIFLPPSMTAIADAMKTVE